MAIARAISRTCDGEYTENARFRFLDSGFVRQRTLDAARAMKIGINESGSFCTAIAVLLAANGVALREAPDHLEAIAESASAK